MDSEEIFMVLVIVIPILILLGAIFLCCWCCHCCCCAKPPQQVLVYPANPNSSMVNTTMMNPYNQANPYNQGYAPLGTGFSPPPNQGYMGQHYAPQQHQPYSQTSGQFAQQGYSRGYQGTPDNHVLLSECPTKGYQNDQVDSVPHGYQIASTSLANGQSKSEGYPDERTALPHEYGKPPPYSSTVLQ